MELKKGFLAIGIIILICIVVSAAFAFLGWNWVNKSGVLSQMNSSFSRPPIEMERSEFDAFIKNLGYTCEPAETASFGDYEFFECQKQFQGEDFTLGITYSKKNNKPVSLNLSVLKNAHERQREIVATVFSELIRIPYKGSNPEAAAKWINQCLALEDVDSMNVSKSISGISFTFYFYAGQYQLTVGAAYKYE